MEEKTNYFVAGVDEAGRGPLVGAVIAAAVILDPHHPIPGLADSKKLSEKQREELFLLIYKQALAVGIGRAEADEIDQINILQASLLAMQRAVAELKLSPQLVLVDGNICPVLPCEVRAIIRGDQTEPAISAASIVAKVTRDREMVLLDQQFPHYGFAQHKGYPTKAHLLALKKQGPCLLHRRSYRPVAKILSGEE